MKTWLILAGLAMAALSSSVSAQNISAGKRYFQQNCAVCHSTDSSVSAGQVPGLFNVVGRKIGSAPKFGYSDALRKAGLSWNETNLDAFLANPDTAMPGTYMPVNVPNVADRANLIAFLKTLHLSKSQRRNLNDFSDMTPEDVAKAQGRAKTAGFDVWGEDKPGTIHHILASQMPPPLASKNVSNPAKIVARPVGAMPQVPAGFKVTVFSADLQHPRNMLVAPNGDIFVTETAKGRVMVLRPTVSDTADAPTVFAEGLNGPFGMAFYPSNDHPQYLYVATSLTVIRYPYTNGDRTAKAKPETIIAALTPSVGGHATRTIIFTPDDKHLLVSIGAATNAANTLPKASPQPHKTWEAAHGLGAAWGDEFERAVVLQFDPDGTNRKPYAQGLRNCVGMALHPVTKDLLCTNNERDYIGDDLPPDYFTRVPQNAFFGWPWYYIGNHHDPRHPGERPDLAKKITVPDLLIQPHSAPLGLAIYTAPKDAKHAFPAVYNGDAFITLHGSGNRILRTGQKIIRVKMTNGVPDSSYSDFMTGFIIDNNSVWGKPVGVVVAHDGALLISDDVSNMIWRIVPQE